MSRMFDSIQRQNEAAERLMRACQSHISAEQRVDDRPAMTRTLQEAFPPPPVTPTDMLHKLGEMK